MVEILGTREAVGPRGDGLAQLEALEEADEIYFKTHAVASSQLVLADLSTLNVMVTCTI